jgi:chromosomal replication initiator protein
MIGYSIAGEEITLTIAKQLVAEFLGEKESKISLTLEVIEDVVCKNYNVDLSDLRSRDRHAPIATPRHIAMYLMRELTAHSFKEIGKRFKRSHATALNSHKNTSETCIRDKSFNKQIKILQKKLEVYRIKI